MNIDQIVQRAKVQCLETGEHVPTIYVGTLEGIDVLILADGYPSAATADKQLMLFGLGRQLGKDRPNLHIQQLVLITEVWVSQAQVNGQRKYAFPADDPDRLERLCVMVLDTEPSLHHTMHQVDMIRDSAGRLRDLYHLPEQIQVVRSNLLPALLAGYTSAALSNDDLLRMMLQQLGQ